MKAVATAPANIAFIKFWGKKDESLRLPANGSISMNLSEVNTRTSVEFSIDYKTDYVEIDGNVSEGKELERVIRHLDLIRSEAGINFKAKVVSKNNFPKGTGIASSASGFAALTMAASKALNLKLSEKKLSVLARLGSGSACRSIPDGFVQWKEGRSSESSYAYSIYPPDYWKIRDVIALVGDVSKKVSSTEGHTRVESSPFFKARLLSINHKIKEIKHALKTKNFTKFGEIIEEEAINMHSVMMTSCPPLFYWTAKTFEIIQAIGDWREEGLEAYFTIDAGPNVHVICLEKDVDMVKRRLLQIKGIKNIIVNKPSFGARIV